MNMGLTYNVRITRKDLKEKLGKEKIRSGKNIHRIIEDALDEYFKKEG